MLDALCRVQTENVYRVLCRSFGNSILLLSVVFSRANSRFQSKKIIKVCFPTNPNTVLCHRPLACEPNAWSGLLLWRRRGHYGSTRLQLLTNHTNLSNNTDLFSFIARHHRVFPTLYTCSVAWRETSQSELEIKKRSSLFMTISTAHVGAVVQRQTPLQCLGITSQSAKGQFINPSPSRKNPLSTGGKR